jgi:hypothetical protein
MVTFDDWRPVSFRYRSIYCPMPGRMNYLFLLKQ